MILSLTKKTFHALLLHEIICLFYSLFLPSSYPNFNTHSDINHTNYYIGIANTDYILLNLFLVFTFSCSSSIGAISTNFAVYCEFLKVGVDIHLI